MLFLPAVESLNETLLPWIQALEASLRLALSGTWRKDCEVFKLFSQ